MVDSILEKPCPYLAIRSFVDSLIGIFLCALNSTCLPRILLIFLSQEAQCRGPIFFLVSMPSSVSSFIFNSKVSLIFRLNYTNFLEVSSLFANILGSYINFSYMSSLNSSSNSINAYELALKLKVCSILP